MDLLLAVLLISILTSSVLSAADDPCQTYTWLNETTRSVNVATPHSQQLLCDRLVRGWHRFKAGEMPFNNCVQRYHCGTHVPIWLKGQIPTVADGVVSVTACYDLSANDADCCDGSEVIRVRNCGHFLVYDLKGTPGCSMAYCAGDNLGCNDDQYSATGFAPCMDAYPKLQNNPHLSSPIITATNFRFQCNIPYSSNKHDASFDVQWLFDGQPDPKIPIVQVGNAIRHVSLSGDKVQGHIGHSLQCAVQTRWSDGRSGKIGPPMQSNVYKLELKVSPDILKVAHELTGQEVHITSSIPVTCQPGTTTVCKLRLQLQTSDGGVQLDKCAVELKPTDWNPNTNQAQTTAHVTTVAGLTTGVQPEHKVTPVPVGVVPAVFTGYQVKPLTIQVTSNKPSAMCSLTGDPHIKTFDNTKRYNLYMTGQYLATKTRRRLFQVDVRTWHCFNKRVTCVCGVVAREGNDVMSLDLCQGKFGRSFPKFTVNNALFSNRTLIQKDATGRNYVFKFPSGAFVKAQADSLSRYMNVFITLPGTDQRDTEGLCGLFDGNSDNDLVKADGNLQSFIKQPDDFSRSWRIQPGQSLFEREVPDQTAPASSHTSAQQAANFCQCHTSQSTCAARPAPSTPSSQVLCPNCNQVHVPAPTAGPVSMTTPATMTTSASVTPMPGVPSYTFVPNIMPGTPVGISVANASSFCVKTFNEFHAVKPCSSVHGMNVPDILHMCVTDVQLSGSYDIAYSALSTLMEECGHAMMTQPNRYTQQANGTMTPHPELKICPGACSGHGQCADGYCTCEAKFEGSDCSIDMTEPPKVFRIDKGNSCDVEERNCFQPVFVGQNFKDSQGSACVISQRQDENGDTNDLPEIKVAARFVSTNEITCQLPAPVTGTNQALLGYNVKVVTAGGKDISGTQHYVAYNGRCMQCDQANMCSQKLFTCRVKDRCYLSDEVMPTGQICQSTNSVSVTASSTPLVSNQPGTYGPWTTLPPSIPPMTTLPPSVHPGITGIAPLGGSNASRPDIWTKAATGCVCSFDRTRTDCACCEDDACLCTDGNMCTLCTEMDSCGNMKPSPENGVDYWTASMHTCGCVHDGSSTGCACCQNFGCQCDYAYHNQCVDCATMDKCGKKPHIFGPAYPRH